MSRLSIQSIYKSYHNRQVVKQVSFEIESGQVVGLLGANGAGKTTCFYIASGLVSPSSGSVLLDGNNITRLPIDRRAKLGIGYLPQEPSIFRSLSVAKNILSALEVHQLNKKQRQTQLQHLLDEFDLNNIQDEKGISLSGGQRRRTEIARIMAINPKFVLLDEPFSGVDPIAVFGLQKLIKQLSQQGVGVLITDHNFREMLDVCQLNYVLSNGEIIASGNKESILSSPQVKNSYLGSHSHYG